MSLGDYRAMLEADTRAIPDLRWNDLGEFVDDELFNNETHEPR